MLCIESSYIYGLEVAVYRYKEEVSNDRGCLI